MISKEKVQELVDEALEENKSLFLLDLNVLPDNKIIVKVDGDKGVSLEECIRISRAVEHNLDREAEDFSIEVTSPDITEPIIDVRQYNKNINRILDIVLNDDKKMEATLKNVSENGIEVTWQSREKKPVGKGKITVTNDKLIAFEEIKKAKVKIIF